MRLTTGGQDTAKIKFRRSSEALNVRPTGDLFIADFLSRYKNQWEQRPQWSSQF